jgi:electron transfer flavoprotein alpha subunit
LLHKDGILMSTLLWIEHDEKTIHPACLSAITAAQQLSKPVHALVIGNNVNHIVKQVSLLEGIEKVVSCQAPYYYPFRAEPVSTLLVSMIHNYSHLLAISSTQSKNILPRVAGYLDCPMLTDVIEIVTPTCFVRPIYAGNALMKQTCHSKPIILSIRASQFEKTGLTDSCCPVESIAPQPNDERTEVIAEAIRDTEKPDLQTAKIVVSGGRAFGSAEQFNMVQQLADELGAAVGATRAAVDAGFIANDYQVGQTGKVVAPELYIAIGISGAVQHLAGMKDSKTIIAINKDADAPIFEIASYGLVGDLFKLVPEMIAEIKKNHHK